MIYQKLKKILGKELQENVSLRDYNTFKIGGKANYFYKAKKIEDLIKAILLAKEIGINYLILGKGSNVLISDNGYDGLVILNQTSNISILFDKAQVIVDSGVMLNRLITQAAEHNLGGLEGLFGIPGTIGGAVYGNIGANRVEINQFIKSITLLNTNSKIIRCRASWLKSGYRTTKIKQMKREKKEIPIILSVKLQLMRNKKTEIIKKIQHYQKIRINKQPYDKFTCGSVFKNPGQGIEGSAGYILDQLKAKGRKVGEVQVSSKHANFIENKGKASASDVKILIDDLKNMVKEEKGIEFEEEIEYMGGFNHESNRE